MRFHQLLAAINKVRATAELQAGAFDLMNVEMSELLRSYGGKQKRNPAKGAANSIALFNRNTGETHQHRRAIARRLRQLAAGTLRVSA